MTNIQERLLESKMTEIEQARSWSPRVISKFETLIRSGDDQSLYRVNPLAFARDRAIAEAESIDLFLHATRCGLFDMSWDVLCPQSGMVLDSFGALRTLKTHYVCGLCDVSGDTDLDDFIEVTFTVSPQLRRLPFHDPETLSVEDFHWKLRFLGDGRLPGQQVRFLDVLHGFVRGLTFLPPGATTTLRADLGPGALAGVNVQTQAAFAVPVSGEPTATPTHLRVRYDGQRFQRRSLLCRPVRSSSRWRTWRHARLAAPDQLAAGACRADDQAGTRLRPVRLRRDAACAADLPPAVPLRACRREGGARHPAGDVSVHRPQGFDRHV